MTRILLLLASLASAQQAAPPQEVRIPAFDCGLVTYFSSQQIPEGCLQTALNVVFDKDYGVSRRQGRTKLNSTAIPSVQSIRRLYPFFAPDGARYVVAVSSDKLYSAQSDGVFGAITGLSSLSTTQPTDCTTALGKFWCNNLQDGLFYWDGTSTAAVTTAPKAKLIANFRNNIFLGGVLGSRSSLYKSGTLDGTDWELGSNSTSAASIAIGGVNDGDAIRCLMGPYQDTLLIGKDHSLYALYGFDNNDFTVREISREVGCLDPTSVQEIDNALIWLSRRGLERMRGSEIDWTVGQNVRDIIDALILNSPQGRTLSDSSLADFELGVSSPAGAGSPMSTAIDPGKVVVSTWTDLDTSSATFGLGTFVSVDSYTVPGALILKSTYTPYLFDNFSDGNYTLSPVWNVVAGGMVVRGTNWSANPPRGPENYLQAAQSGPSTIAYSSFTAIPFSGLPSMRFKFSYGLLTTFSSICLGDSQANCALPTTSLAGYCVRANIIGSDGTLGRARDFSLSANGTIIISTPTLQSVPSYVRNFNFFTNTGWSAVPIPTPGSFAYGNDIEIARDASGTWNMSVDGTSIGTAANSAISSMTCVRIDGMGTGPTTYGSILSPVELSITSYPATGSFTSRAFNTSFSTPTWGALIPVLSSPTSTGLTFQTQVATSASGAWDAAVTASTVTKITSAQKQFVRYIANFTSSQSTSTPQLSQVTLSAATTGYFVSRCLTLGTAISSWDLFSCDAALNGGTLTYYVSTGATCGTLGSFVAIDNNTTPTLATAAAVKYRVDFSIDTATQTPTHRSCTFNWFEGATRPETASGVYDHKYHIFFTTTQGSSAVNDSALVLDNKDRWARWDSVPFASTALYDRKLFGASNTTNGFVYQLYSGDDDAGDSFTSTVRTKDYDLGNWKAVKQFDSAFLEFQYAASQATMTVTAYYDSAYSVSLGTVTTNEEGGIITAKVPFPALNQNSGRYLGLHLTNTGSVPWRWYRGSLRYRTLREK